MVRRPLPVRPRLLQRLTALGLAAVCWAAGCSRSAPPHSADQSSASEADGDYRDASLPAAKRTSLLLAQMTLEEKVGQMCQYVAQVSDNASDNPDEAAGSALSVGAQAELIRAGRVGSFLKVRGPRAANLLQRHAAESRLAIPLLIGTDAIHGHGMSLDAATIFPSPIALASSFDPALLEKVAQVTALEMRATGFHWTFSPNVDVVRDARWGRTGETFGEDTWLVGQLGAAMVRGYQGADFSGPGQVLACVKHLVGGGVPVGGLNGAPAELSERTLREEFLPPFEAAIRAGAYTLMPAHNEVGGVPCHGDEQLLRHTLRDEWGFAGFVVSDWLDIERLHTLHRVAETPAEADRQAVLAGVDMHMHGDGFFDHVLAGAQAGTIPQARIDEAVSKILFAKFQLGLFEHPEVDVAAAAQVVLAEEHRALALEAARKSLVLLKNANLTLPLTTPRSVLVTGPDADDQSLLGDWVHTQPEPNVTSVVQGLRAVAPDGVRVEHVATGPIAAIADAQIEAATRAAARSDVVVLVLGENSLRDNPERTSGENVDRASLEPGGRQLELMAALVRTGKPIVVVLVNGGPIASEWLVDKAAAVLEAWEPGMAGGQAIAEALFGKYNPSGRMPITVPRSAGHVQAFYNHRASVFDRSGFRFSKAEPLFEFGHGLSYTTFAYSSLQAEAQITRDKPLGVTVQVENTGPVAGDDIVLLYVQDLYASVTRPVQSLAGSQRVSLAPRQRELVRFELPPSALSLWNRDHKRVIEPGQFRIQIGADGPEQSVELQ